MFGEIAEVMVMKDPTTRRSRSEFCLKSKILRICIILMHCMTQFAKKSLLVGFFKKRANLNILATYVYNVDILFIPYIYILYILTYTYVL